MSVTPQRGTPLARCSQVDVYYCSTLRTRLLPSHVVSAKTTCFPVVRILGLLVAFKRPGNTDSVTWNTCYLNARLPLAWAALWQLPFSGMTSFGCVLDRTMLRRGC